jgi:hypothetical protein
MINSRHLFRSVIQHTKFAALRIYDFRYFRAHKYSSNGQICRRKGLGSSTHTMEEYTLYQDIKKLVIKRHEEAIYE